VEKIENYLESKNRSQNIILRYGGGGKIKFTLSRDSIPDPVCPTFAQFWLGTQALYKHTKFQASSFSHS